MGSADSIVPRAELFKRISSVRSAQAGIVETTRMAPDRKFSSESPCSLCLCGESCSVFSRLGFAFSAFGGDRHDFAGEVFQRSGINFQDVQKTVGNPGMQHCQPRNLVNPKAALIHLLMVLGVMPGRV